MLYFSIFIDGNLIILFAPHIGCNDKSCLGKYSRRGQISDGAACGAAVGALNHCLACTQPIPDSVSLGGKPYDYQQNYIISEISKRIDKIKSQTTENDVQATLVREMFDISYKYLEEIVHLNFGSKHSNLILLGGVQINMPGMQHGKFIIF